MPRVVLMPTLLLVLFSIVCGAQNRNATSPAPSGQQWVGIVDRVHGGIVTIETQDSQGTGFLIQKNGIIVTNNHVIKGAIKISIRLDNGESYNRAYLLANDETRDLALLRIEGADLQELPMGNSDQVKPGEDVLLLGAPRGLEQTVSTGIVSAVRILDAGNKVIQTTTPASPGSSGGPLFNRNGEAIGVMTFSLLNGQNLNFAVPINYVRGMLDALSLNASISAPRLIGGAKFVSAIDARGRTTPREVDLRGVLVVAYHGVFGDVQFFRQLVDEIPNYLESAGVRVMRDTFEVPDAPKSLPSFLEESGASRLLYVNVKDFGSETKVSLACVTKSVGVAPQNADVTIDGSVGTILGLMRLSGLPKVLRDRLAMWHDTCLSK